MSANDKIADAIQIHSIDLERFSADLQSRVLPILDRVEKSLAADVAEIDPTGTTRLTNRQARLKALLQQTQGTIATGYAQIADTVETDLHDVAKLSDTAGRSIVNKALGVEVMTVALAPEQLRALADDTMIQGAVTREHWSRQEATLVQKFTDRVQEGYIRGESSTEIISRVRGTKALNYADGIMVGTKSQAATLVRTSVQAVSHSARLEAFKANSDILSGVQWISTLDSRTSTGCRARSMLIWDLDGRPQGHSMALIGPPAHFNCRSTLVSVLRPWSEVSSNEDFDLPDGSKGTLPDLVRAKLPKSKADSVIDAMQASMGGPVSADLDYESWLKLQPIEVQMDVLGPEKHRLWTEGRITFRDLVDQRGNPLTLSEIIAKVESGQTVIAKAEKLEQAEDAVAAVGELQKAAADADKAVRDQVKASIKAGYLTKAEGALLKDYAEAKIDGIDPTIPALNAYDKLPEWFQAKVTAAIDAKRAALKAEAQAGPAYDYVMRKAVADSAQKLKSTLHKADQAAVWIPGQITDGELHGIPFDPWQPPEDFDWMNAPGKNPSITEPPMPTVAGKKTSAGVIIIEDDGRIWIYEPTNHFGGYKHTFPKGTLEGGLDLQATAIKEAWEESGLQVEILGHLGDYEKSTSVTRYYIAKRTGGAPWQMGWEAQNVKLVPQNQLPGFLNVATDKTIAHDAIAAYQKALVAGGGDLKTGMAALDAQAKELAKKAAKTKSSALSEWVSKTAQGKAPPPSALKVFDSLDPDEQAAYAAKAAAKKADIEAGAELAAIRAGQSTIPQEVYKEAANAAGSGWPKKSQSAKLSEVQKLHAAKLEQAAAAAKAEADAIAAAKAAADAKALAEVGPIVDDVAFQLAIGKPADEIKGIFAAAADKPALAEQWKAIAKTENAAYEVMKAKYDAAPIGSPAGKAYDAILDDPDAVTLPYSKLLPKLDAKLERILKDEAAAAAKAEEAANLAAAKAIQEAEEAASKAAARAAADAEKIAALQVQAKPLDVLQAEAQAAVDKYVSTKIANPANKPKAAAAVQAWMDNQVNGSTAGTETAHLASIEKYDPDGFSAIKAFVEAKKSALSVIDTGAPIAVPDIPAPPVATEETPAPKPKKAAKPKTGKTVKAAKGEPDPVAKTLVATDPPKFENLTQTGPQGGSNLGGFFTDKTTNKVYYVKAPTNEDIARNEVLTAKLYEMAGVAGPKLHGIQIDGTVSGRPFKGYGIASELLEGEIVEGPAALKAAAGMKENFAVDAWLANWDVTGPDFKNSVSIAGQAVRLDVGGSLRYRAQGSLKTNFKAPVLELESLLDPGINAATARTFGGMTTAQLEAGVSRVLSISDADIRKMVADFGPIDQATNKELADTLIARKQWLADKFPHLAKPQKEVPTPPAVTGKVTKLEMQTVVEARSNGYVRMTDKDMVEDQHVQLWVEKDEKGKLAYTGAGLKLRNAGMDILEKAITKAKASGPSTTPSMQAGPPKANTQTLDSAILTAVKGIASRAAKGMPLEQKDIDRAKQAAQAFATLLEEMETLGYGTSEKAAVRAHYQGWIKDLKRAADGGVGNPAVWVPTNPGPFAGHIMPPAPVKVAAAPAAAPATDEITWTKKAGVYEAKVTAKGWLTRTGSPINFKAKSYYGAGGTDYEHYYEAKIDGVTVRYWSNEPEIAQALRGKLELVGQGSDAAAAAKLIDVMDRLGLDTERPDPLDLELRYLQQIAFNRKHKFPPSVMNKEPLKAKVNAMHDHLSKAVGYELRQSPHWNPEGVRNAYGHSRPFALRPDMDSPATDDFVQNYGFAHQAGGNGLLTMFKTIMDEGGFFAPKADFFRRGKDFTAFGMSPTADMTNGGGAYVYTRVQPRTHGGAGLFWDGSLARRVDARTHKSDPIGKLLPEAQRIQADGTAGQYDKMKGTYETIYKGGISLFEHRFQLRVESARDRTEAIDWLKTQGEPYASGRWPDGRTLEEVIVVAGTVE